MSTPYCLLIELLKLFYADAEKKDFDFENFESKIINLLHKHRLQIKETANQRDWPDEASKLLIHFRFQLAVLSSIWALFWFKKKKLLSYRLQKQNIKWFLKHYFWLVQFLKDKKQNKRAKKKKKKKKKRKRDKSKFSWLV